jgi:hypothetical protein
MEEGRKLAATRAASVAQSPGRPFNEAQHRSLVRLIDEHLAKLRATVGAGFVVNMSPLPQASEICPDEPEATPARWVPLSEVRGWIAGQVKADRSQRVALEQIAKAFAPRILKQTRDELRDIYTEEYQRIKQRALRPGPEPGQKRRAIARKRKVGATG